MSKSEKRLIVGMDVGTSSVKMSVLHLEKGEIIERNSLSYDFITSDKLASITSQQNACSLIECIQRCLLGINESIRRQIGLISVCGQMHGCILWKGKSSWSYNKDNHNFSINPSLVSDLYTWQDSRCTPQFISSLPKPVSYLDTISSGFGCATIYWLKRHTPNYLQQFTNAGTIMDFLVAILCDLQEPLIDTQNAMSWGYFDPVSHTWNEERLKSGDFPTHLLPKAVKSGSIAGKSKYDWVGIEANTPVMVAFGDMQCSCYASMRQYDNCAVLNVSTSMQLSFLMPTGYIPENKCKTDNNRVAVDYYPYFGDRFLSVAASLNGGNVLHSFVKSVQNTIEKIANVNISYERVCNSLFQLADTHSKNNNKEDSSNDHIMVKATLFGERYDPTLKLSINNICPNTELSDITNAVCEGLIENIFEMMPVSHLINAGVQRLIGTGGALLRNPILKKAIEQKLNIPVIYLDGCDADAGAAWVASFYYYNIETLNDN